MSSNLELVFERWRASLQSKSKKRSDVGPNFDELFDTLKRAGASLEDARKLLPDAIKAHQPTSSTAKFAYNNAKRDPRYAGITQNEFAADWNKDIADRATASMYIFFPIPEGGDDDGEPKLYEKMSAREYALQQAHADSFEMLDVEEVRKQNEYLSEEEMLRVLEGKDEQDPAN